MNTDGFGREHEEENYLPYTLQKNIDGILEHIRVLGGRLSRIGNDEIFEAAIWNVTVIGLASNQILIYNKGFCVRNPDLPFRKLRSYGKRTSIDCRRPLTRAEIVHYYNKVLVPVAEMLNKVPVIG